MNAEVNSWFLRYQGCRSDLGTLILILLPGLAVKSEALPLANGSEALPV